jgi:hypothetical protein
MIWLYILGYLGLAALMYVHVYNRCIDDRFKNNLAREMRWRSARVSEAEMYATALDEAKGDVAREEGVIFFCGLCAAGWPIAVIIFVIRAVFRLVIKGLSSIPLLKSSSERKVNKLRKNEEAKLARELAQKEVVAHYKALGIDTELIEKAWKL